MHTTTMLFSLLLDPTRAVRTWRFALNSSIDRAGQKCYGDGALSIKARRGEVVSRRVAEVAPMRILLDPGKGYVGGCRHVGEVQVQRDVA